MADIIYGYKLPEERKGYWGVNFYDDNGKIKNHWLSGSQIQYFKNREDAVKYVKEVKSWNAIKFTQYLIVLY